MASRGMKLKNPKRRKVLRRIKVFIYFLLIYLGFSFTFYYSMKDRVKISNEEFINLLVSTGNGNILSQYKMTNLVNGTMKFLFHIDFRNPKSLLRGSVFGGDSNHGTKKTIKLEYNDDYSDMDELKKVSDYIHDPNPKEVDSPLIYFYNSHQLENYSASYEEIYGITPNVMMVSYVLRENLEKKGISSIVEESNMSEVLEKNGWNYSYSYLASRSLMESAKAKYSSLKYFVDIHRDSVAKQYTLSSINGKNYAKILFVVGQDYSGWEKNYQFALSINRLFDEYYPNLSRGVMLKTGPKVNGVYNQDVSENVLLIEVGGVENSIDEVYSTTEAMADVFFKYIKGEKG